VQIVKVLDPSTGLTRFEHKVIGNNFETQSIKTDMTYHQSAIGEMNNDELDQLKVRNEKRIEEITERYFEANKGIKTAKEIMREQQEHFEIKEKFKDSTINYPNYGRGMANPPIQFNTFMVQEKMCEDKAAARKR